jgi:hypothetical protein
MPNMREISHNKPVLYTELAAICAIIGVELLELAKPLDMSTDSLYNVCYRARNGTRSPIIELRRLDNIRAYFGDEDFETALEELRMPENEREDVRNTKRIAWGEAKKMLAICGATQSEFAQAIQMTVSGVNRNMGWHSRRRVSIRDIRAMRELLGEVNFERSLAMVRATPAGTTKYGGGIQQ